MQSHEHVVFKRAKHKGHDESHGGAWKVAFADFMIALMALFLVLWILQVADQEERKAIISSFENASLFDKDFGFLFETDQSMSPIDFEMESSPPAKVNGSQTPASMYQGDGEGEKNKALIEGVLNTPVQLTALANLISEKAQQLNAAENLQVSITPQGLRVVLQDADDQPMFKRGRASITPFFEDLLISIAPIFEQIENSLIISGHTDSTLFKKSFSTQSNWELSVNRANQARKTLMAGGTPESRILQVSGMSDRTLLNEETPASPENRRIELFVLTAPVADLVQTLFGKATDSQLSQARDKAIQNRPVKRESAIIDEDINS